MIKVLGGEKKGKSIFAVKGDELRPTSGKVKAAIFNILGDKIQDAHFLDLFAGSGSVGIEALSRGANHVTFIEKDKKHFKLLKKNIEQVNYQHHATLISLDAIKFREITPLYDIVFTDPPYSSGILEKILPEIGGSVMIKKNGILIVEHFKKEELEPIYGFFSLKKRYSYGDTHLSLFQRTSELSESV
jgi:16S rRNA (guanine966-N2)-methyltransferase